MAAATSPPSVCVGGAALRPREPAVRGEPGEEQVRRLGGQLQLELTCAVGVVDDAIDRALAAQFAEESAQLVGGVFIYGGDRDGGHGALLALRNLGSDRRVRA
jgi:hypothetical protein